MNMFDRFQENPLGFDSFNAWMRHYELFVEIPIGCADFGAEWMALWRGAKARLQWYNGKVWTTFFAFGGPSTPEQCYLEREAEGADVPRRIILLEKASSTIIKEWGPR